MDSIKIKTPTVKTEVLPLILKRWSPYSFDADRSISDSQMDELFEAANWAASAFNEQPWKYVYALRGTEGFEKLWSCLAVGNQAWTKSASVLIAAVKKNTFSKNGKVNTWAAHDLGMANAHLLLQAVHRDIYGHLMAGFDNEKLVELLELEENFSPVCMGALGYLGTANNLDESYKERDQRPRSRQDTSEFIKKI